MRLKTEMHQEYLSLKQLRTVITSLKKSKIPLNVVNIKVLEDQARLLQRELNLIDRPATIRLVNSNR